MVRSHAEIDPDAEIERLAASAVRAIPRFDAAYSQRLRKIHAAPPVIYLRGEWLPDDEWSVAVVDTRRAALEANERTVAVLASGVDTIYLAEHTRLADEIAERGALITDYPLGTKPRAEFFPRRNHIMSSVALGTLIVKGDTPAAQRSPRAWRPSRTARCSSFRARSYRRSRAGHCRCCAIARRRSRGRRRCWTC